MAKIREEYLIKTAFNKDLNDYLELYDDAARQVLVHIVENWRQVYDATMNHTITLKNAKGGIIKYTPTGYDVQFAEADSWEEFLDGTIMLDGSCTMRELDDTVKLTISTRNFRIYEVGAVDMLNDKEYYIVEKGYVVNSAEVRVKNPGEPGKMMTSILFDFGKKVE